MKTQLKTEVQGVLVELSVAEALAFLADPTRVQRDVRVMLNGGGVDMPEPKSEASKRKPIERVPCPHCGKKYGKTGLGTHMKSCPDRPLDDLDEEDQEDEQW